jgi:RNA polymerase sigma factor (TIGR02999 family)
MVVYYNGKVGFSHHCTAHDRAASSGEIWWARPMMLRVEKVLKERCGVAPAAIDESVWPGKPGSFPVTPITRPLLVDPRMAAGHLIRTTGDLASATPRHRAGLIMTLRSRNMLDRAVHTLAGAPCAMTARLPCGCGTFGRMSTEPSGGPKTSDELLPLVYGQLRAIAAHRMAAERPDHTLQATALVHEAYARIAGDRPEGWTSLSQFYAAAAEAMRRILIEHARSRGRVKRGGDRTPTSIDLGGVADLAATADTDQILALDDAIRRVSELDEQMGQVVRLRFFAGLTIEQTAESLGISPRTVKRDWTMARAMLYRLLTTETVEPKRRDAGHGR